MNHFIQASALLILTIIFRPTAIIAQSTEGKWQIGISSGILVYQGDLIPSGIGAYNTVKPSIGLHISRVLSPYLLLRTNLAIGSLCGNDSLYDHPEWRKERNFRFTTPVTEISELLVWNISGNTNNQLGRRFSPYVFGGIGISLLNIKRDYSDFNEHYFATITNVINGLNADIAHNPPRAALVLPFGLGMEFYLSPKLSLTAETNLRYTFTDYLDGFSLGANPEKKDFYHSHSVGLLYRFGGGSKFDCPPLKP